MSKPVTKGGFSNDGSKIMQQTQQLNISSLYTTTLHLPIDTIIECYDPTFVIPPNSVEPQPITISTTLHQSQLSLSEFYTLSTMAEFIQEQYTLQKTSINKPFVISIQSPDELLIDCQFIINNLRYILKNDQIHFYILGDTSYSQCCVDIVAAGHISSNIIVHLGFACLSNIEHTIPVYYAFGVLSLFNNNNMMENTPNKHENINFITFPLQSLIFKLLSSNIDFSSSSIDYTVNDDDYDEYPDELTYDYDATNDKYQLLLFVDQRYMTQIGYLRAILGKLGFTTRITDDYDINHTFSDKYLHYINDIAPKMVHFIEKAENVGKFPLYTQRTSMDIVFAVPSISNTQKIMETTDDFNLLEFSGYTIPLLLPQNIPNIRQLVSKMTIRQRFHRFLNKTQYRLCLLTNYLLIHNTDRQNNLDLFTPDPQSSTLLAHFAMNFTQHYVYNCAPLYYQFFRNIPPNTEKNEEKGQHWLAYLLIQSLHSHSPIPIPADERNNTIDFNTLITAPNTTELLEIEMFSPSAQQNRVLSQRFYLVEKAKNCDRVGIVAGTLSSQYTRDTLKRLQSLLTENDIKHYTIIIGKLNEAKLLNFGDITMFVVITCPMSVLFNFHNKHGQLFQTTIDQSNPLKNIKQNSSTLSSMIDMITPFECEMAFNTQEYWWNGLYTTHSNDMVPNKGRFGLTKEEEKKIEKKEFIQKIAKNDEEPDLEDDMKDAGVRYSSIDNKYHKIVDKKKDKEVISNHPEDVNMDSKNALVEQQTYGLVDPTTNKQLIYIKNNLTGQVSIREREFNGLAQEYVLEDINMSIQPGQHGTSEGYIRFDQKNDVDSKKV